MPAKPECPRCGTLLRPPNVMHESYLCPQHGQVAPLQPAVLPDPDQMHNLLASAAVPAWLPWPLPATWVFTGLRIVGGDSGPSRAVAIGLTGTSLATGPADLIIVSEQPGTGLGARLAGLASPDPDQGLFAEPATITVTAAGWPTPLWSLPGDADRTSYVGVAAGEWLWLVGWPELTWSVIHDDLRLIDVRKADRLADLPRGALMPRLQQLDHAD